MKIKEFNKYGRRCVFVVAFLVSQLSFLAFPSFAYADPTLDTQPPVLQPSIKEGDLRNTVTFHLDAIDEHLQSTSIEILASNDTSLTPRVLAERNDTASGATLVWQTGESSDGDYKVKYHAADTAGNATTETYGVKVTNAQPLLTISDKADGRTIGGTVTRDDVTFEVKVDGVAQEVTPQIAPSPDNAGTYMWTLLVPQEIVDGVYTFEMTAASQATGQTSLPVSRSITLTTPLKVTEPTGEGQPIPVVVSISDYAEEVGQFIAPSLPVVPQTKLYGVSTTDITANTSAERSIVPSTQQARASLFSGDVQPQVRGDGAPIAATESGWMFFGVAWYWWGIVALILSVAATVTIKSFQRDQSKHIFVGAESV